MSTKAAVLVSITVLAALTGCVNDMGGNARDDGHEGQEIALSADDIRAQWRTEGDWLVSPSLDSPDGASRVGVLLTLVAPGAMPAIEARATIAGEPQTEWRALGVTWSEEEQHVATVDLDTIGDGAELRIRGESLETVAILRIMAAIPDAPVTDDELAESADDLATRSEALRSELSGLGIVTRESWGARATRCTSRDSTRRTRIAIHHTVTGSADPARQMRGIQRFHMDSRGWCDVGYHFLVGSDGRIYEGRPAHLLGAHVGGHNSGNLGISFIGCFHSSGCSGLGTTTPSSAMIDVAGRLVGTLRTLYGITIDSAHVRGHRDHSGQSTTCPGDHLRSRIPDIISIGRSRTLSSGSAPPPSSGASCTHTYGGRYGNRACSASYQCCDGRWRERDSGCGSCDCVEATGRTGCQ